MVTCEQVRQELSNFLDDDVAPELRQEILEHLGHCHRCSILADTTRKLLLIVGDDRVFEFPVGYSQRLHHFLDQHLQK